MSGIYDTNDAFQFDKLVLTAPTAIPGGNYFIKFRINEQPLYIQPPKCKTKQGIMGIKIDTTDAQTAAKNRKMYCDLMFTNENENFIRWMENLENYAQKCIYDNRTKWFETDLELDDIENSFTSSLKLYKSGKFYIVRTNVPSALGKCSLKIYDENENEINNEALMENSNIMTILEIQGIKCSARSFQIEIELKQIMAMNPTNLFEKCIIKPRQSSQKESVQEPIQKELIQEPIIQEPIIQEPILEPIQEPMRVESIIQEKEDPTILTEVEFDINAIESEPIQIKERTDVYYKMYREARQQAKNARNLALASYLEAKRIKNTYMLETADSESDLDENELNQ